MRARDLLGEQDEANVGVKLEDESLPPGGKQKITMPYETEKLFSKINQDCQEYIQAVKQTGKFLLRGASGPDVFLGRSWLARKPKDSNPEAAEIFDQMLQKSGMTALRSNSIFATTDEDLAEQFGDRIYIVFPLDHKSVFTYTNRPDLTLESIADVGVDQSQVNTHKQKVLQWLQQFQSTDAYTNLPTDSKNLIGGLRLTLSTITLHNLGNQLTLLQKKNPSLEIPHELLYPNLRDFVTLQAFEDKYQPTNENLAVAMQDQLEVYIHGLYYALNLEKYGTLIADYWLGNAAGKLKISWGYMPDYTEI